MMKSLKTDDGHTLKVHLEGEGRPGLLLVHGFPFDHRQWGPQIEALSGVTAVAAPDLRGLGASEGPGEASGYSMDRYARDLVGVLDGLGWEEAVFAGLSMGGYIALAFHRLFPRRLAGLVLMDTHPYPDSEEGRAGRKENQKRVRSDGPDALVDEMVERVLGPTTLGERPHIVSMVRSMISEQPAGGVIGALEAMAGRPSSVADLAGVGVPSLVMVGSEDTLTTPVQVQGMAAKIPGARFREIRAAGHLVSLEAPEAVNEALRSFLEEEWGV
ncbi:MAG: alpha/beta fold hydrolase [bacterium]